MLEQFEKLQKTADKDQCKENSRRRKITLHSFRRTCFSIINDQVGSEYANWFLGHNHSAYWTRKEQERSSIYLEKCMPYLTILDYSALDNRSKNIETALKEKDKSLQQLTKQVAEMQQLESERSEEWGALKKEMYELKRLIGFVGSGDSPKQKQEHQIHMAKHLQQEISNELQREYYEAEEKAEAGTKNS
jgi:hypothetical protein